jgi:hypothetical protein
MRFHSRHYILIAVVLAVGAYRLVQSRHGHIAASINAVKTPAGPPPMSPAWSAFDKAASLRDADDDQFSPALQDLDKATGAAPEDPTVHEVKGCQTWLMFYRQSVVHPSHDKSWKDRSTQHLDTCVQTHHDLG